MRTDQQDIEKILADAETENKNFSMHSIWRELGIEAKDFRNWIETRVHELGIAPHVWEEKLREAREILQTRLREKSLPNTASVKRASHGIKL